VNEETLLLGRMVLELTHRADYGSIHLRRQDDGWRVELRIAGQRVASSSPTLLMTATRMLRRVLEMEANADLAAAGSERALTLGALLAEAGLVSEKRALPTTTEGGPS